MKIFCTFYKSPRPPSLFFWTPVLCYSYGVPLFSPFLFFQSRRKPEERITESIPPLGHSTSLSFSAGTKLFDSPVILCFFFFFLVVGGAGAFFLGGGGYYYTTFGRFFLLFPLPKKKSSVGLPASFFPPLPLLFFAIGTRKLPSPPTTFEEIGLAIHNRYSFSSSSSSRMERRNPWVGFLFLRPEDKVRCNNSPSPALSPLHGRVSGRSRPFLSGPPPEQFLKLPKGVRAKVHFSLLLPRGALAIKISRRFSFPPPHHHVGFENPGAPLPPRSSSPGRCY